jgi:hypothetical protein
VTAHLATTGDHLAGRGWLERLAPAGFELWLPK